MLQSSEKFSLSLPQLLIDQHWMKGEVGLQNPYIRFSHNFGFKNKNIQLLDFKDVDFNFTHFANFKFAYFEIEESFG